MEYGSRSYKVKLSEKELAEAISDYIYKETGHVVNITNLEHLVGVREEGYGLCIDVPYQDGVRVTVTEHKPI